MFHWIALKCDPEMECTQMEDTLAYEAAIENWPYATGYWEH